MALANLIALASDFNNGTSEWVYEGEPADDEFFAVAMQEYCYTFHSLGTPSSYEAFRKLSEVMNGYYPENMSFLSNIGSYHMLVKHDYKTALKYYDKALKIDPEAKDIINNAIIAARKLNNSKLEKKYIKMLQQIIN
jgi:tetratricopeptide (TPR) repeat protein